MLAAGVIAGVVFAADEAAPLEVEGDPFLKTWVAPVYPEAARADKVEGKVLVRFVVDEAGHVDRARVMKSPDGRLDEAALAAVRQWVFMPAESGGRKLAAGMEAPVVFSLKAKGNELRPPEEPRLLPVVAAQAKAAADPVYPEMLIGSGMKGRVRLRFKITPEGGVRDIVVEWATDPIFVPPTLRAVRGWTFRPAMQGDLAVEAAMGTEIGFDAIMISTEGFVKPTLEKLGLTVLEGGEESAWEDAPTLRHVVAPVTPYALGMAGRGADATVSFRLSAHGDVTAVEIVPGGDEAAGRALAAAISGWDFNPARRGETPVGVAVRWTWHFGNAQEGSGYPAELWRRVASGEVLSTAKGLDRPLRPIYRTQPVVAKGTAGKVTVRFVIDREGFVQMARADEGADVALSEATVLAVSQWCFEPPMREGQPVEVRAAVPVEVKP